MFQAVHEKDFSGKLTQPNGNLDTLVLSQGLLSKLSTNWLSFPIELLLKMLGKRFLKDQISKSSFAATVVSARGLF